MNKAKILLVMVLLLSATVARAGVVDWRNGTTSFPDAILDLDAGTAAPDSLTQTEEGVDCTITLLPGSSGFVAGDSDKPWGNDSLEALFNVAQAGATHLTGPRHAMAGNNSDIRLKLTFSPTTKAKYLFLMDVDFGSDSWVLSTDGSTGYLPASRFLGTCDNEDGTAPLSFTFGAQYDEATGVLRHDQSSSLNEPVSVFDITGLDTVFATASGGTQIAVGVDFRAINPTPVDGASGENVTVLNTGNSMEWFAPSDPNVTGCFITLDSDPNFIDLTLGSSFTDFVATIGGTIAYDPPITFTAETNYYWRVDLQLNGSGPLPGDPNTIEGFLWTFDTLTAPIYVPDSGPVDLRVDALGDSLSASFTTATAGGTVKWFQVGTPDVEVASTALLDGEKVYTYVPVAEGTYYARAEKSSGSATSNFADVILNRLLAQYDLDGSLAPAAGSLPDAPTGTALTVEGLAEPNELLASPLALTYVTGIDGSAAEIAPGDYVDFGTGGYPRAGDGTLPDGTANGSGLGLDQGTILFWLKPTTTGYVFSNLNPGATSVANFGLRTNDTAQDARVFLRIEDSTESFRQGRPDRPGWDVFDGEWHLIAFTWEAGAALNVYVDGQQVASGGLAIQADDTFAGWTRSFVMGVSRTEATLFGDLFGGAVDKVRIYNYRLDADSAEVFAQEYFDATGIVPCTDQSFSNSPYNLVNDGSSYCVVDVADFADFAAQWLANGLWDVP